MRPATHFLRGAYEDLRDQGRLLDFEGWRDDIREGLERGEPHGDEARYLRGLLEDHELAAITFARETTRSNGMAKKTGRRREQFTLPTKRRTPVSDPWEYAYLLTGEKKIGKTTLANAGCEALTIQFDKPQLAYEIIEECPPNWHDFERVLQALEAAADAADFPYQRVVIDGVGEWWQMSMHHICKPLGVKDPGEMDDYGKTWRHHRNLFTDAMNRLLRLQNTAQCGLVFIAHSEWGEKKTRDGRKIERLQPNLPRRCEEIVNGKVDAWFQYDYHGDRRVLITLGDETTAAGHRIDGHFLTTDGRRVREIDMGEDADEALAQFLAGFNNELDHADLGEARAARVRARSKKKAAKKKKRAPRRSRARS